MASNVSQLVLLLVFICGLKSIAGNQCRPGFKGKENSCYYLSRWRATFADASSYCKQLGGALAIISGKDENKFLKDQAKKGKGNQYFIGASDLLQEGVWRWYGKEPLIFKDWGPKEPNNSGKSEHCMTLLKRWNYRWNDSRCTGKEHFICEVHT